MDLEVDTRIEDGRAVVTPRGEIDLATVESFREALNELVIQGHVHLVVDLDQTLFIDSLGFGALVGARRRVHAFKGSLGIICSNERILRLFRVSGLDRVLTITESVSPPATPA